MADETVGQGVGGAERTEPTGPAGSTGLGAPTHAGRPLRTSVSNPRRTRL